MKLLRCTYINRVFNYFFSFNGFAINNNNFPYYSFSYYFLYTISLDWININCIKLLRCTYIHRIFNYFFSFNRFAINYNNFLYNSLSYYFLNTTILSRINIACIKLLRCTYFNRVFNYFFSLNGFAINNNNFPYYSLSYYFLYAIILFLINITCMKLLRSTYINRIFNYFFSFNGFAINNNNFLYYSLSYYFLDTMGLGWINIDYLF